MKNETLFGAEAREKLKAGVAKTYKAIAPTLGPKGRSAILSYGKRYNSVTLDDGVSIADFLVLEDPFENEGAKLIKEVASKTNDEVGDSTTTSTVLAYSMLDNALKNITAGSNPTLIKKGMQRAVKFVVQELNKLSIPISTTEDVRKVATISANNAEMGEKVAEAVEAVTQGAPEGDSAIQSAVAKQLEPPAHQERCAEGEEASEDGFGCHDVAGKAGQPQQGQQRAVLACEGLQLRKSYYVNHNHAKVVIFAQIRLY